MPKLRKRSRASGDRPDESECGRQRAIRSRLWNSECIVDSESTGALLAQYRIYVESAEKVSDRRGIANNFFLAVNSAVSVALAAFGWFSDDAAVWPLLVSATIMISICALWGLTLHNYRQLNSVKWRVVNVMEERLLAAPWLAEWQQLNEGNSRRGYRRITVVEEWVPGLFASIYAVGFVVLACFG